MGDRRTETHGACLATRHPEPSTHEKLTPASWRWPKYTRTHRRDEQPPAPLPPTHQTGPNQ